MERKRISGKVEIRRWWRRRENKIQTQVKDARTHEYFFMIDRPKETINRPLKKETKSKRKL